MLRLSKLADYAVVVMVRLSHGGGSVGACHTSPSVAAMTGLPEPTVAKVLKALAAAGLVISQRGARGGYRLARPLQDVSIADVVSAIDGPIALAACVDGGTGTCESEALCPVRGRWDPVNQAVLQALRRITLADMAPPIAGPSIAAPVAARHPAVSRPVPALPAE